MLWLTSLSCLSSICKLLDTKLVFSIQTLKIILSRVIENEVLCGIEEGYNTVITGMNRGITVGIAVYRYILVFYPHTNIGEYAQKNLRRKVMGIIFGTEAFKQSY